MIQKNLNKNGRKQVSMSKFISHLSTWSIRTRFSNPGLLDFQRNLFKKKKEIWNFGEVWAVDAITLNFLTKLDSTDCSMGLGDIRYLKWHDVNNSNSWFLTILNGFSEGFSLFKLIKKKKLKSIFKKIDISSVKSNIRELEPPTHSRQFDANWGKIRYVSNP